MRVYFWKRQTTAFPRWLFRYTPSRHYELLKARVQREVLGLPRYGHDMGQGRAEPLATYSFAGASV